MKVLFLFVRSTAKNTPDRLRGNSRMHTLYVTFPKVRNYYCPGNLKTVRILWILILPEHFISTLGKEARFRFNPIV
jgi:hypothetical protein